MKILLTAKQRGSTNVLAPVARELLQRGHQVTLYATGNETEAAGFNGLPSEKIEPNADQYNQLVRGYDAVVLGLSGHQTPDGYFLRAANAAGIPTVAVQDQNSNYVGRLGINPTDLPTILAVMDETCIETARKELGGEMGEAAAKRCRVVGWPAFDHYAILREKFTEQKKEELLSKLELNTNEEVYFHATQNIHPNSKYAQLSSRTSEERMGDFAYELNVTNSMFKAAADMGLKLTVKPHPGEDFERNYTADMAKRYGCIYISAKACSTQELMLAAYAVSAGRSTCLAEATLLDRNTGAILPGDHGRAWSHACPPVALNAIPVTYDWEEIGKVLSLVASHDKKNSRRLAEDRKKFSVDGKASKRLADLVEELGGQ